MTEALPFLDPIHQIPSIRAGWVERYPELPITGDREEAMNLLRPRHEAAVREFSPTAREWWRAEQIHSAHVATVPGAARIIAPDGLPVVPGVDGLITREAGIVLAIYVADCGAIWLADRKTGAIGLVHSGKKGTEGNIFEQAIRAMTRDFGTRAEDVTAVLSPCIRPPHYEVNFAGEIARQAEQAGVGNFLDSGLDTAADLQRFYSYRQELGKTGRMMALITCDELP